MIFGGAAVGRSPERPEAGKEFRPVLKEDKPCSRCGHLCSAHASPHYTKMHCITEGCSCGGYFPSKSYEAVVQENIALHLEIESLKDTLEPFLIERAVAKASS